MATQERIQPGEQRQCQRRAGSCEPWMSSWNIAPSSTPVSPTGRLGFKEIFPHHLKGFVPGHFSCQINPWLFPEVPVAVHAGFAQAVDAHRYMGTAHSQAPQSTDPVAGAESKERKHNSFPLSRGSLFQQLSLGMPRVCIFCLGQFFLDWPKWTNSFPGTDQ